MDDKKDFWILALFATVIITALPEITSKYPIGYAGLYVQFSQTILDNSFLFPTTIPYYVAGGLPFAYPPLSFYLMAFFLKLFPTGLWTYLSITPMIFSMVNTIAVFALSKEFFEKAEIAIIAAFAFSVAPYTYALHGIGAGVTRAPALCFTLWGLYFLLRWIRCDEKKSLWLSSVFFALTILTHLGYVVFFILTAIVFLVQKTDAKKIFIAGRTFFIGFIATSFWWGYVIYLHGFQVFFNAFSSHGNISLLTKILDALGAIYFCLKSSFLITPTVGAFFVAGLIMLFLENHKDKWLWFSWFATVALLISENQRYLTLIGSIVAGYAVWKFSQIIGEKKKVYGVILIIFTFSMMTLDFLFHEFSKTYAGVDDSLIAVAEKLNSVSDENDCYLFISDSESHNEWMPYLSQRTPTNGYWGTEWMGNYDQEIDLYYEVFNCNLSEDESYFDRECVDKVIAHATRKPKFILVDGEINSTNGWTQIFRAAEYQLYMSLN